MFRFFSPLLIASLFSVQLLYSQRIPFNEVRQELEAYWLEFQADLDEVSTEVLEETKQHFFSRLEFYYQAPLNINTATAAALEPLFWLSALEVEKLLALRAQRPFQSVTELRELGLEAARFELTRLFLTTLKPSQLLPTVTTNLGFTLSYRIATKTVGISNLKNQVGAVEKYHALKTSLSLAYLDWLAVNLLLEHDAGEYLLADLLKWGVRVSFPSKLFSLYGGALTFSVGQQLLFATGYSPYKNDAAPSSLKNSRALVKLDRGSKEAYFEGVALNGALLGFEYLFFGGFYHYAREVIANDLTYQGLGYVTTLSEVTEPSKEKPGESLKAQLMGVYLSIPFPWPEVSGNFFSFALAGLLSHPVLSEAEDNFYGRFYSGLSAGAELLWRQWYFYTEAALTFNEKPEPLYGSSGKPALERLYVSWAAAGGVKLFLGEALWFFAFRALAKDYNAPHRLPYSQTSAQKDELGFLTSYQEKFKLNSRQRLSLSLSFDFFKALSQTYGYGNEAAMVLKYTLFSSRFQKYLLELKTKVEDNKNLLTGAFWIKNSLQWREASLSQRVQLRNAASSASQVSVLLESTLRLTYFSLWHPSVRLMLGRVATQPLYTNLYFNAAYQSFLTFFNDGFIYLINNRLFLFREFELHFLFGQKFKGLRSSALSQLFKHSEREFYLSLYLEGVISF